MNGFVWLLYLSVFFIAGCGDLTSSLMELAAKKNSKVVIDSATTPSHINTDNMANFPVEGTCPEGASEVRVGAPIDATFTCVDGKFSGSVDLTTVPEGIHETVLTPNVGGPISWSIEKDTTPPSLILNPVATFINLNNQNSYSVSGTCSENGRFVYLEAGALRLPLLCSAGVFAGAMNLTTLAEGVVSFQAELEDLAGNAVQDFESATKDTLRPGVASVSNLPQSPSPVIQFNSVISGADIAEYSFKVGAASAIDCAEAAGYSSWRSTASALTENISALPDVELKLCVLSKDLAGNDQLPSNALSFNWVKDSTLALATVSAFTPAGLISNSGVGRSVTIGGVNITDYKAVTLFNQSSCGAADFSAAPETSVSTDYSFSIGADGTYLVCVIGKNIANSWQMAGGATASGLLLIDRGLPSVSLTSVAPANFNTSTISVTATFSESVTGFDLGDIGVANGVVSGLSGSGTTYTFTVTPSAQGLVTVSIASGVAQDAAGNLNTAATNLTRTYDSVVPTVTLTSAAPSTFNTSTISVTATFSESVTGLALADIGVTNGVASGLSGSGTTYTFTVTPSAQGLVTVSVAAGVAQDAAGNLNTAATNLTRTYDSVVPTVTLTSVAPANFNTSTISVTATFSESVTGFALADIGVTNGVASVLSGSGTTYTFTVTPSAQGLVTVSIASGVAQDAAGNLNTAATNLTRTYDSVVPTVTLTSAAPSTFNTSTISVTATFSESVTGFVLGDIGVTNGVASALTGSGTTYTFTVTPSAQGLVTVSIASGVAQDAAGNLNSAATNLTRTYDSVVPTVTLTSAAPSIFNTSTISVTATFSESVTGFVLGDIGVTNGVASGLSGSGTTYTFTVTPSAQGLVTVSVAAGVAQDAAGNQNTAATNLTRTYDSVVPTVTLTSAAPSIFNTSTISVTATFSESVTGLALADIGVTNGVASGLSGSGTTYTFTVTPSAQGLVTVSIASGVAQDAAGNLNTAATNLTRTYDSVVPTVTLTSAAATIFNTSTISVTATFSESVTGFALADIGVTNGVASALSGSGTTYTFTVTPSAQGLVTVSIAAGVAQDAAGNLNTAATNLTRTYDSIAPTITGLVNDSTWRTSKTWSWGCSESCTYRFVVDSSPVTTPTGGYSATTTATQASGTGDYYLHVEAMDAAGNLSLVHVSARLDNTAPLAATSVVDQNVAASLAISPVITFTSGSDAHSGLNRHEARVIRVSDSVEFKAWSTFVSGSTISGLSLATNTSYRVQIRTIDQVGNISSIAQSDGWMADVTAPSVPTGLSLGAVPSDLASTPTLSWNASTDTGGSGVSSHQVRIFRTSDNAALNAWTTLSSGNAISGLSLGAGTQYYFRVKAFDNAGNMSSESANSANWTSANCIPGSQVFTFTGVDQTFTVPAGCSSITVKMWGAGGGAYNGYASKVGGGGGFVMGSLAVTSGETLTVVVGQGGRYSLTGPTVASYGGGGAITGPAGTYDSGGQGGGRSAIQRGVIELLTAGGGGGAGYHDGGGAGGGLVGAAGTSYSGGGGTQSAGGAAGPNNGFGLNGYAGAYLSGGAGRGKIPADYPDAVCAGGSGGGGYFGGGSGGVAEEPWSCEIGPGGGGSSYLGSATSASTSSGSGNTPGNAADADRTGAGAGGINSAGAPGRVIISW